MKSLHYQKCVNLTVEDLILLKHIIPIYHFPYELLLVIINDIWKLRYNACLDVSLNSKPSFLSMPFDPNYDILLGDIVESISEWATVNIIKSHDYHSFFIKFNEIIKHSNDETSGIIINVCSRLIGSPFTVNIEDNKHTISANSMYVTINTNMINYIDSDTYIYINNKRPDLSRYYTQKQSLNDPWYKFDETLCQEQSEKVAREILLFLLHGFGQQLIDSGLFIKPHTITLYEGLKLENILSNDKDRKLIY